MTKPHAAEPSSSSARPGHVAFESLGLSAEVLRAVKQLGFEETSPIQSATIPLIMAGQDVVGQSQTGSGKTAAFCIPAIEQVVPATARTQVLILVPTRELSTQVADEVHNKIGNMALEYHRGKTLPGLAEGLRGAIADNVTNDLVDRILQEATP